jgi:hypothetical protein
LPGDRSLTWESGKELADHQCLVLVTEVLISGQSHLDSGSYPALELVKTLISKGADINAKDDQGNTTLRTLMSKGISTEDLNFLTSIGAQP